MEFITLIILLFFNYFAIRKTRRTINSLSLFTVIWIIMVLFAKIRLFDLNESSWQAYLVVDLGAIFFSAAFFISLFGKFSRKTLSVGNSTGDSLLALKGLEGRELVNFRLYIVLFIIVSFFQIIFARRAVSIYLINRSLRSIHYAVRQYDESGIVHSGLEKTISWSIVQPFVYASIPISLTAAFAKIKHYKSILVMSVFLSITYIISHAGRIIIVDYIVYLLVLMQAFRITISKRTKRRILYFATGALAVVVIMTASRRNLELSSDFYKNSFLREIYEYFAIPIPQLSYWMEKIENSKVYSSGIGFFNGFLVFPIHVFGRIGLNASKYYNIIKEIDATEQFYTYAAFNSKSFNAFVTAFFFFYADFRYVGVIIESFVFGFVSGQIEKSLGKGTYFSFVLYLMFLQSIARSFVRWQFYNVAYVFSFLFVFLCCRKLWRFSTKQRR